MMENGRSGVAGTGPLGFTPVRAGAPGRAVALPQRNASSRPSPVMRHSAAGPQHMSSRDRQGHTYAEEGVHQAGLRHHHLLQAGTAQVKLYAQSSKRQRSVPLLTIHFTHTCARRAQRWGAGAQPASSGPRHVRGLSRQTIYILACLQWRGGVGCGRDWDGVRQ